MYLPSTFASDLTPEQSAKHKEWQAAVNDKSASEFNWPKEMCGIQKGLPISIDKSLVAPFMEVGNEANFYCTEIRDKLSTICRNAKENIKKGNKTDNKASVVKLINRITCKIGSEEEDSATFEIKNGELIASLGPKASNISEKLYEFLLTKHSFNNGEDQ
jgi:hypothetical protein